MGSPPHYGRILEDEEEERDYDDWADAVRFDKRMKQFLTSDALGHGNACTYLDPTQWLRELIGPRERDQEIEALHEQVKRLSAEHYRRLKHPSKQL